MPLQSAMSSYVSIHIDEYRKAFFPDSDLITFYGGIEHGALKLWETQIANLVGHDRSDNKIPDELVVLLSTPGGSAECVEKMVDISRTFYKKISFVIPSQAMSAGTIWAMSGDDIYMSYMSSLGPIDPQVQNNEGRWVPAMCYLDKFEEIVEKSRNGTISQVELMMISQLDLASLKRYEQASDLSVSLLVKWLTAYKFKDWTRKETSGEVVDNEKRKERAEEIAKALGDNSRWLSHNRFINIDTLQNDLNLKIKDYSRDEKGMFSATRSLDELVEDFKRRNGYPYVIYVSIKNKVVK